MSFGLFILRVVVGALFVGHGTQKLFGWYGGHGPEGTGGFLESLGYPRGKQMAIITGIAEAGGGLLLLLGLLTPLATAAIIGVMINAAVSAHAPNGLWNDKRGYELPLVYGTVAAAIALIGPGQWSMDNALGLDLEGGFWGIVAIALGLGAAFVVLSVRKEEEAEAPGEAESGEGTQAA
jgi:putative oxidoreductase